MEKQAHGVFVHMHKHKYVINFTTYLAVFPDAQEALCQHGPCVSGPHLAAKSVSEAMTMSISLTRAS